MKKLFISEILLYSPKKKRAKKVEFHPRMTIITGVNGMGKSCLIKSIYRTLGTDCNIHPRWEEESAIALIKFKVDDTCYDVLRYGSHDNYALFDGEQNVIGTYDSSSKGLGLKLAEIFDFKLLLNDRNGISQVPPPAYLFLPFYLDQDTPAWSEPLSSFRRLSQFPRWRDSMLKYHTGVFPNEYYGNKIELENSMKELKELTTELKIFDNLIKSINAKLKGVDFNINIEEFKTDIDLLVKECNNLYLKQQKIRAELVDLHSEKLTLEEQIKIASKTKKEIRADFKFASTLTDDVECPTCGTHYHNGFAERFAIAQDEHECEELIFTLKQRQEEVGRVIESKTKNILTLNEESNKIYSLLTSKKSQIELRDIIESEGKREVKQQIEKEKNEKNGKVLETTRKVTRFKDALKAFENKDREEGITTFFKRMMRIHLHDLDLLDVSQTQYAKLDAQLGEMGSSQPRIILAYFFAILKTIKKFGDSTFCPIIIDSPNQNGQDEIRLEKMLKFIVNMQIENSQVILGTETLGDIDLSSTDCKIIEFKNKNTLLDENEYESVGNEIISYIDKYISFENQLFDKY
jgi:hypothetical protein